MSLGVATDRKDVNESGRNSFHLARSRENAVLTLIPKCKYDRFEEASCLLEGHSGGQGPEQGHERILTIEREHYALDVRAEATSDSRDALVLFRWGKTP